MPEPSRRRNVRAKHDRKKLSRRTVLALIDRFLDVDDESDSESETNSSDYDSEAENRRPARRENRHRDERSPRRKRARRDRHSSRHDTLDRRGSRTPAASKPAWAEADAIRSLGQNIADVVREAAPSLLSDEATTRKLEVGLAKVVADFAIRYGIGESPGDLPDSSEHEASAPSSDEEPSLRVHSRSAHVGQAMQDNTSVWTAPPLPSRQSRQSSSRPNDSTAWATPDPSHRHHASLKRKGRPEARHSFPSELPYNIETTPHAQSAPRPTPFSDPRASSTRLMHAASRSHTPHSSRRDDRSMRPPPLPSSRRVENSESPEPDPDIELDQQGREDSIEFDVDNSAPSHLIARPGVPLYKSPNRANAQPEPTKWGPDDDDSLIEYAQSGLNWDEMAVRLPGHPADFIKQQYVALHASGALGEIPAAPRGSAADIAVNGNPGWEAWSAEDKRKIGQLAIEQALPLAQVAGEFPERTPAAIKCMVHRMRKGAVDMGERSRGRARKSDGLKGVAAASALLKRASGDAAE